MNNHLMTWTWTSLPSTMIIINVFLILSIIDWHDYAFHIIFPTLLLSICLTFTLISKWYSCCFFCFHSHLVLSLLFDLSLNVLTCLLMNHVRSIDVTLCVSTHWMEYWLWSDLLLDLKSEQIIVLLYDCQVYIYISFSPIMTIIM